MSTFPASQTRSATPVELLAGDARVKAALQVLATDAPVITEEQIRITEIPAPPFHEAARGAYVARLLRAAGLKVHTDSIGNVIGELRGSGRDVVALVAHLDTVFPADTPLKARREGSRIYAPGISDNGAGLAALVALARSFHKAGLQPAHTILFVADVGEEGEGNLRGMRHMVETYRSRLRFVIALDGSATDHVTTAGLGSRRLEITISGPGGHSWTDFGTPNPVHALARGIARFIATPVPVSPRTSFNIGEISGGTSVNSIPSEASAKVDLRSESDEEIAKLSTALETAVRAGVDEEVAAARYSAATGNPLRVDFRVMGIRPSGELPDDSPLLSAVLAADDYLGNRSRLERSSTDANIPLSLGIPAVALGAGGRSGAAHSAAEWYDPTGREAGLQRILLALLQVAGLQPAAVTR